MRLGLIRFILPPRPPMISTMKGVCDLAPGACADLVVVGGERSFRRRLMELGCLPGTRIRLVRRVDVGDLIQLEVRGCQLSLRRADAAKILVRTSA